MAILQAYIAVCFLLINSGDKMLVMLTWQHHNIDHNTITEHTATTGPSLLVQDLLLT